MRSKSDSVGDKIDVYEIWVEEVLIELNQKHGMTVVLVEQNVEFARRASQHFVVLDRGNVVANGSVAELTDDLVHQHMAV